MDQLTTLYSRCSKHFGPLYQFHSILNIRLKTNWELCLLHSVDATTAVYGVGLYLMADLQVALLLAVEESFATSSFFLHVFVAELGPSLVFFTIAEL